MSQSVRVFLISNPLLFAFPCYIYLYRQSMRSMKGTIHTVSILLLWSLIFVEILSSSTTTQPDNYTLFLTSQEDGSACLDGTPTGVYVHEGTEADRNNFLIYFDSGGFCGDGSLSQTLESCYKRSFGSLGSTAKAAKEKNFNGQGILSPLENENPLFHNWTKVFVIYCDGSEYQGSREKPIPYKDRNLHFRGADNVKSQLKFLNQRYNIYFGNKIVITGVSAGGIATYQWSNYVYDNSIKAKVYSIPDSGMFLTDYYSPIAKMKIIRERSRALLTEILTDYSSFPIQDCLREFNNDLLSCFDASNIAKYIKPPMLIIESLYDAWSLANILGVPCLSNKSPPLSIELCSDEIKKIIEDYHVASQNAIKKMIKEKPQTGVWSPSCIQHGFTDAVSLTMESYKVPYASGKTSEKAIEQFLAHPERPPVYMDSVLWPANKGCNGLSTGFFANHQTNQKVELFE